MICQNTLKSDTCAREEEEEGGRRRILVFKDTMTKKMVTYIGSSSVFISVLFFILIFLDSCIVLSTTLNYKRAKCYFKTTNAIKRINIKLENYNRLRSFQLVNQLTSSEPYFSSIDK